MKQRSLLQFGLGGIAGVMLVCLILFGLFGQVAEPSYADTVPTPVYLSGSSDALNVTFWSDAAVAASAASSAYQMGRYEYINLQYNVDQPTTINTVTIKSQWSNDPLCVSTPASAVWSDGPNVVAANVADADSMIQIGNLGRCTRLYATVGNTESITIDVWGLAR